MAKTFDLRPLKVGAQWHVVAARAQPRSTVRRVGVLNAPAASDLVAQARAATLARALGALHWHEGDNLRIDWRWTGGEPVLYDRYAAELVGLADVILAGAAHLSQCCGGKRQQSRSCLWS